MIKEILETDKVAELLGVPEITVQRWVHQGKIPYRVKKRKYIFIKDEIINWAQIHKIPLKKQNRKSLETSDISVSESIKRGDVYFGLQGNDSYEILKNAIEKIDFIIEKERLLDEIIRREEIASTGIGNGIAIPHPGRNFKLKIDFPITYVFFLKNPIDFNSVDNEPIKVIFMFFTPSVEIHLKFISRLSFILKKKDFIREIKLCKNKKQVLELVERVEKTLTKK